MGMSGSRITVSTAGVASKLRELLANYKVNLAVSLNSPDEKTRLELMPLITKKYSMDELLAEVKQVAKDMPNPVTFEYVLIKGVTDKPAQAHALLEKTRNIRCKINLIPFNPFPGSKYERPSEASVEKFHKIIRDAGTFVFVRWSQGLKIGAACGQLSLSTPS